MTGGDNVGLMSCLLTAAILIRVILSPTVPGILDLQRCTETGWQTYNNIALLVEANGVWNSAELDGGTITENRPGVYDYARLPNGTRVRVEITVTGPREVRAVATVLEGNVTRLALSNDYGLAEQVRYVADGDQLFDALSFPEPPDGVGVMGRVCFIPPALLTLFGNGVFQYQDSPDAGEAMIEVRRHPWLVSQPDPGHNWIERAHLTRAGGGEWRFGFSEWSARFFL